MPITLKSTGGGSVSIDVPSTGSTFTLTAPANNATIFTTDGGAITGNVAFTSNNVSIGGQTISPFGGMKNRIINGDMRIWQRATSFADTTTYTADRWFVNRAGGAAGVTASRSGSVGNYYLKVSRNSGTSGTGALDIRQVIETLNCADLAGQNVTLSFNAYAGANFSASNLLAEIRYSTATDDGVAVGGSWASGVISILTLTTTSTKYTVSYTVPSNALTLMVRFYSGNYSGTAGADDSVYINNVQLELGSVATPFERRLYGTELALCQRYYQRMVADTGNRFGVGQCYSTTQALIFIPFPVTMRSVPSALEQSGTAANYRLLSSSASGIAGSSVPVFNTAALNMIEIIFTVASGLTAGNATAGWSNATGGYLGWSAEL